MYRVIKAFADRADEMHNYQPGDVYPRAGVVNKARVAELMTSNNATGVPLIVESAEQQQAEQQEEKSKATRKRVKKNAD